jgi:hypothetical protein
MKGVDWINLALHRSHWKPFVNTLMNLFVLQNAGNFLTGSAVLKIDPAPWI